MEQRDIDGGLNLGRHLVHGVGADQQEIGAAILQLARFRRQQTGGSGPVTGMLQPLDTGKIDAVEQHPRRVQTAELCPHPTVERLIVTDGGLPAHATQQTDTFHMNSFHPKGGQNHATLQARSRGRDKKGPAGPTRQPVKARVNPGLNPDHPDTGGRRQPHAQIETAPTPGGANDLPHLGTKKHPERPCVEAGNKEDHQHPERGGPVSLPARVKPLMAESAIIHALGLSSCSMAP